MNECGYHSQRVGVGLKDKKQKQKTRSGIFMRCSVCMSQELALSFHVLLCPTPSHHKHTRTQTHAHTNTQVHLHVSYGMCDVCINDMFQLGSVIIALAL